MKVINSDKVRQICDEVWCDRASILSDRGNLSGETALVRAVYWRLCKIGEMPDDDDYAPFLQELVRQYRDEAAASVTESYAG
ncbi:MAG TPA: hypothetical protein VF553_08415 [Pyrinomonadaceae bacterium]|jgi:hypothetical protein